MHRERFFLQGLQILTTSPINKKKRKNIRHISIYVHIIHIIPQTKQLIPSRFQRPVERVEVGNAGLEFVAYSLGQCLSQHTIGDHVPGNFQQ